MNPAELAKLVDVSGDTLRRWTKEYSEFLSPSATPPKGQTRVMTEHDQRVLLLVSNLRNAGQNKRDIKDRLAAEQKNDWETLPAIPGDWGMPSVRMDVAASRASEMATVAALQTQLQHVTQELAQAQARVTKLEQELAEGRERERTLREENIEREHELLDNTRDVDEQRQAMQVELLEAKATVARLEGELKAETARLEAYGLGRGKPLNVGLLIVSAILFGALLVVVIFVVARLLV